MTLGLFSCTRGENEVPKLSSSREPKCMDRNLETIYLQGYEPEVLDSSVVKTGLGPSHCKACPGSLLRQQPQALKVSPARRMFALRVWILGSHSCPSQQVVFCEYE